MFVVAPAVVDVEVAARQAFVGEAHGSDEGFGGLVLGDDVGFDAMEAEWAEGVLEGEGEGVAHESLSCVGLSDPVSDVAGEEGAADDAAEADLSDDDRGLGVFACGGAATWSAACGVVRVDDEESAGGVGVSGGEEAIEPFGAEGRGAVGGRGFPGFEEGAAGASEGEEFGTIVGGGRSERDRHTRRHGV